MNLLNNALGVHERALNVKSRRLEVLAQNIANADTPHYKARDIDFKAVMTATQQDNTMKSTDQGHFSQGQGLDADGMRFSWEHSEGCSNATIAFSRSHDSRKLSQRVAFMAAPEALSEAVFF